MNSPEPTPTPEQTVETQPDPKQLVVLSGKGGTGKTSVVAAFATLATDKVLADCDVDAPDLHLILAPETKHSEVFISGKEATILPDVCTGCSLCVGYCRFDAIREAETPDGRVVYEVDPIACEGCGLCALVCEDDAVEMIDAERGEWFISDTRSGPMVHATLRIGGENSGKLVTVVRNEAVKLAKESGLDLVIVDGPPGVGCPVIASVTGADLVLAVTEPTVSGAHDLERLSKLVKGFGLTLAVCVNKSDLNPEMAAEIRTFCAENDLPVVGELSYDTAVVKAQVEGASIIERGGSPVADEIREMWTVLEEMLRSVE